MFGRREQDWDPRESAVINDQRRAYDQMRERCPVAYSDFLNWSIFRHADIVEIAADPETYSSRSRHLAIPNGMDPPEHTVYRQALAPFFEPDQMKAFEPVCRQIARNVLQPLIAAGQGDCAVEFAQPFSAQSLCALLGWPIDKWKPIWGWTHGNQEAAFSQDREAGRALAREFAGFVHEEIEQRRARNAAPTEDVTASLMAVEVDRKPLSEEDLVSLLRNWTAGHGTVAASIGNLVLYLIEHPDDQQRLRDDPGLLPAAIDEILRVDGPLVANRRTTTRAVEIEGRAIDAGETLSINWIAANRDDRAFHDATAVRFDRDPAGNLLFGTGIHDCLGAPLARLEMRVAMEELLATTKAIEFDPAGRVIRARYPSNGVAALPTRFR